VSRNKATKCGLFAAELQTLEARRMRYELIWFYEVLFRIVRTNSDLFEIRSTSTQGCPFKLFNIILAADLELYFYWKGDKRLEQTSCLILEPNHPSGPR